MWFLRAIKKIILFHLKLVYAIIFVTAFFIALFSGISDNTTSYTSDKIVVTYTDNIENTVKRNKQTFTKILIKLENIRLDETVKTVVFDLDNIDASFSQSQELAKAILDLKASNKRTVAVGSLIDKNDMYISSFCDEVYMPDMTTASINLNGYYSNTLYYTKLLDKLGISFEVINTGEHKTFNENLHRESMSSANRETQTRILEKVLDMYVSDMSQNYNIAKDKFKDNLLNSKYYFANVYFAKENKLITDILPIDKYNEILDGQDISTYLNTKTGKNTIAVINLGGSIENGMYNAIDSEKVEKVLKAISRDKKVAGVVLRINSPGGSAYESEKIYCLLKSFKQKTNIPVYTSIDTIGTSGAYYISLASDKIYTTPSAITGSIGVVGTIPKVNKLLDKLEIKNEIIKKGENIGIYDPTNPINESEKEFLKKNLEFVYKGFTDKVIENRKIDKNTIEDIAKGRIWLGIEAKQNGLIDDLLTLKQTINKIADDYNIQNYDIAEYQLQDNFTDIINNFYNLKYKVNMKSESLGF